MCLIFREEQEPEKTRKKVKGGGKSPRQVAKAQGTEKKTVVVMF